MVTKHSIVRIRKIHSFIRSFIEKKKLIERSEQSQMESNDSILRDIIPSNDEENTKVIG